MSNSLTANKSSGGLGASITGLIFRLLGLAVIDAFALWFVYVSIGDGGAGTFLAIAMAIVTIGINAIFLNEKLYPLRWLSPGLALMVLMVLYPVGFTTYTAFTNYGTGHLLTQPQSIQQLEKEQYVPEGGVQYEWTAFRSDGGDFLLWVIPPEGEGLLMKPGKMVDPASVSAGELDKDGIPKEIPGYTRLNRISSVRYLSDLSKMEFGSGDQTAVVKSLDAAAPLQQKYTYDAERDVLIDHETGTEFTPVDGVFTASDGTELRPGYYVTTGTNNFERLFRSPAFRGPFIQIFIWTIVFAALSVLLTFGVGLLFAIVYNDATMPFRKIIRSLLLISYAIPPFISVMMWRGLLNPSLGVISLNIAKIFGSAPAWFADPTWAKIGILLIQTWLGFPYMMLICTGALQTIPSDLYEAADVDGASIWQKFRGITLPLLLVAVGPLLIGSFAFNFNNFTVIDVFNQGGPPIPNSPTQAGHTDILITYIFRLAFASGRGVDYAYASAITIVIFVVLSLIVLAQFQLTKSWEEVSENV